MLCVRSWLLVLVLGLNGCSLGAAGFSSSAQPERLSVLLVYDTGLDCGLAEKSFRAAAKIFARELNIVLENKGCLALEAEPNASKASIADLKQAVLNQAQRSYDIIYVLLNEHGAHSTLLKHGRRGYAEGVGVAGRYKNSLAYGVGLNRPSYDSLVMTHEIGHLLGARHSSSGIMFYDSSLLAFSSGFSRESIRQIRQARRQNLTLFAKRLHQDQAFHSPLGAALE